MRAQDSPRPSVTPNASASHLHPGKVLSVSRVTTGPLRLKAKSLLWPKPAGLGAVAFGAVSSRFLLDGGAAEIPACENLPTRQGGHGSA